jgi:hypothetical protein
MIITVVSVAAGLALLANGFIIFPGGGLKSLAKSLGVTIALAFLAAVLISAIRSFGS